jgi:hypothetical protein
MEVTNQELEEKIRKGLNKSKKEKLRDFKTIKTNLPMAGGGVNDFMQAAFQVLAGLAMFVKFFLSEKHKKQKAGTTKKKPVSDILSRVFEMLIR